MKHPFLTWSPDPASKLLGTRMNQFKSDCGIDGLARENGHGMIELLAVVTNTPGKGQFREFIRRLKLNYQVICVWHIENEWLAETLKRYGFQPENIVDEHGDAVTGMRWDKPI